MWLLAHLNFLIVIWSVWCWNWSVNWGKSATKHRHFTLFYLCIMIIDNIPKIFNILSHIKDMHLMHYLELTEYSSAHLYGRLSVVTAGTDWLSLYGVNSKCVLLKNINNWDNIIDFSSMLPSAVWAWTTQKCEEVIKCVYVLCAVYVDIICRYSI